MHPVRESPCYNKSGIGREIDKAHGLKEDNMNKEWMEKLDQWRAKRENLSYLPLQEVDLSGFPVKEYIRAEEAATYPNEWYEPVPAGRIWGETWRYFWFKAHVITPSDSVGKRLIFAPNIGSESTVYVNGQAAELMLREAEWWGVAASILAGYSYPLSEMDALWKRLLLNQFHDILPGTSIRRVIEEAEADLAEVFREAEKKCSQARRALAVKSETEAITVFNSLSWDRVELVKLPRSWTGVKTSSGGRLPAQRGEDALTARVKVPAAGWVTLYPSGVEQSVYSHAFGTLSSHAAQFAGPVSAIGTVPTGHTDSLSVQPLLSWSDGVLENELLRIEINGQGELARIWDKEARRDISAGVCNRFCMYKDTPPRFGAWEIEKTYGMVPVALEGQANIRVLEEGPLEICLEIERTLHHSPMKQIISLAAGSRVITFRTRIDNREKHKLLKVAFPVSVHANEAIHEIQFGHIRRPNHASRPHDRDRYEVSQYRWTALTEENRGCAVLNDCKYGIDTSGSSMNLTLLRSSTDPDPNADEGIHEFSYAFYAWNGSFGDSEVVRRAAELNCPVSLQTGETGDRWLFRLDTPHVMIDTVKPAEDGSGDVIIRLYEAFHTSTNCALTIGFPFHAAVETDMLEQSPRELSVRDNHVELPFRPFEIKTVRVSR